MVKVKENLPLLADGQIDIEQWLNQLAHKGYRPELPKIRHACTLSQLSGSDQATETGLSCLRQGLNMADILADLKADVETLIAAIVFENVHYADLTLEDVEEQLGLNIARLVIGVEKMCAIHNLKGIHKYLNKKQQLDNIRKMLLAMVDDARVVLIKLSERLTVLRASNLLPESIKQDLATEAMDIYAPLANRLGIGAIKWELEDLAFRYLHPDNYKFIAQGLKYKRLDRDHYVNNVVTQLNDCIEEHNIKHFSVYGRSKHIHSIYRKMMRKKIDLNEVYDATAVRVLVNNVEECYQVLGIVHNLWSQIPAEFDDYIMHPKENGYQSLHTAVEGPEAKQFEVQIRTFEMHDLAEMGVAAHWKYKEGAKPIKEGYERKIDWLRDVLAWHREMTVNINSESIEKEFLDDRVYVFTPEGDVLDLPLGVTPLDFAYHIHSKVGHRCRGAKVNGSIVPLIYQLKTGDQVEILTSKEERPSRDWINPHLQYLKTSRAKAKVLQWFRSQDYDKNKSLGQEVLEKELKGLNIKIESLSLQTISQEFNFKKVDDLLAALGRGELKLNQLLHKVITPVAVTAPIMIKPKSSTIRPPDLTIEGVGNLLTNMAGCCQPIPGDEVIGYITLGRGVSIHRQDCSNVIHASDEQKKRLLAVSWGSHTQQNYLASIFIKAFDRAGLLKDITALLAHEKANVFALQTQIDKQENLAIITLTIEINNLTSLSRLLAQFNQIPNVLEAHRQS